MTVIPTKLVAAATVVNGAAPAAKTGQADGAVYIMATVVLQTIMCVSMVVFAMRSDWENLFLTGLVVLLTLIPAIAWRGYRVHIPPEVQLLSAAFVFLSLFLGSAMDLYYEVWWWDLVLHLASGALLGIAGFIAVFALNRRDSLPRGTRPIFISFFGVTFAVFCAVIWEIFEYTMDRTLPNLNMQSGETGVVDTMEDLIVNTLGAVAVGFAGWAYLRTGRYSWVADGIRALMRKNPTLFRPTRRGFRRRRRARAA